MKTKKMILWSLALILAFCPCMGILHAGINGCGCAPTYMGLEYSGSLCTFDKTGEMLTRICYYEY